MNLDELLSVTFESKASDLHLKAGNVPYMRVQGQLRPLAQYPKLTPEDMQDMAFGVMTEVQRRKFKAASAIDMPYFIPGVARFRVNVFQQRGTIGMALRVIPIQIPSLESLNLPKAVGHLCEERRGMVLVTGATGTGKSTTLAAMVDRINTTRADHIVTIEDPIEFLHSDKLGFVDQQEVDVDTPNFGVALRGALRQDPDVILVGEMRDIETISTALLAAETGHLVLSTLHTLDATETVQRMIAAFPLNDQKQIRLQLAATLKGVLSQRLVRRASDGSRIPAVEVLITTDYIRDCILNPEKTTMIRHAIVAGVQPYGMQSFDQALHELRLKGLISLEEALAWATNPEEFRLHVQGIRGATDTAPEELAGAIEVDRFEG